MKIVLGYLLIFIGLIIVVTMFGPLAKEEIKYQVSKTSLNQTSKEIIPIDSDFGLVIPSLNINSKVVAYVDPVDPLVYQKALTLGVAHAKGSALPSENGNIFIFSHSSENFFEALRYNSIFYLLNKLKAGDIVDLYYKNTKYNYKITETKVVNPEDISYLKTTSQEKTLTLMTCYPPGTNFKRLIVIANNVDPQTASPSSTK